jgi:hypothetical protein
MLSFSQFLMLQSKFAGGPSGARPFDNIPMGDRGGNPQTVFQNATKGQFGNLERMKFAYEDVKEWDMQWCFAAPYKPSLGESEKKKDQYAYIDHPDKGILLRKVGSNPNEHAHELMTKEHGLDWTKTYPHGHIFINHTKKRTSMVHYPLTGKQRRDLHSDLRTKLQVPKSYLQESEEPHLIGRIQDHLKDPNNAIVVRTATKNFGPYKSKHAGMFSNPSRKEPGVWIQHGKGKMYADPSQVKFGHYKTS